MATISSEQIFFFNQSIAFGTRDVLKPELDMMVQVELFHVVTRKKRGKHHGRLMKPSDRPL